MTDQLSGGLPFAPQPKGLGSLAGDYLHKARLWMDEHTPGMGMATSFMGGLGAAAPAAGINQQGGILNDPSTISRMQGYVKQASPFGGAAAGPAALFGPPTYPGTPGMMQADSFQPRAAAPEAPQAAPALPEPTVVGAGRVGMPMAPRPSSFEGPTSVGGAPLPGMSGVTPQAAPRSYELGARMKAAGGHLGGDGGFGFTSRNTAMMRDPVTGDFIDPQAAKSADANGPDLIKKFMNYLHSK